MTYLWLSVFWMLYFMIHSVLAMSPVKNSLFSMGLSPERYRLAYNIIALATLLPVIIYSSTIASEYLFAPHKLIRIVGLLLAGWGVIIARAAFKSYDIRAFLGLRSLEKEDEFTTSGLLLYVRHPVYSGSILGVIGYFLYNPRLSSLVSVIWIIIYFLVGIQFEEKKLIRQFGKAYLDYKEKTPMLIPRIGKYKKIP